MDRFSDAEYRSLGLQFAAKHIVYHALRQFDSYTPLTDVKICNDLRHIFAQEERGVVFRVVEVAEVWCRLKLFEPEKLEQIFSQSNDAAAQIRGVTVLAKQEFLYDPDRLYPPEDYIPVETYPRYEVSVMLSGYGTAFPQISRVNSFTFRSQDAAMQYVRDQQAIGFKGHVEIVRMENERSGDTVFAQ